MSGFGAQRDATIARRFSTRADPGVAPRDAVRIGFVFGPRALRRFMDRNVSVVVADGVGSQRLQRRQFADVRAIARFLAGELNRSFARAQISTRVSVGAVARLAVAETRPRGPHPGAWLADLCDAMVRGDRSMLPLECWCAARAVNCAFVLVDWDMSRTRIERGGWAGFAPRPASGKRDALRFHPVAIVDLCCALTAHSFAHEFGHIVGCTHDGASNRLDARASGFAARGRATFSVMAAGRRNERGRRLEWSRPPPDGADWAFGDADHDEAAWLRFALPSLSRQRFACAGRCDGACAELATRG